MSNHPEIIIVPAMFVMFGYVAWITMTTWHRRQRIKAIADFNTRLLDRLGSVKDFSEFLHTDAGARLMQDLGSEPSLGGPHERILRATQLAAVLACLGIGMLILSFMSPTAPQGLREALTTIGTIALSLGVGFGISSAASYRLAGSLGLLKSVPDPPRVPLESRP